jgi:hypothetical protein
MEWIITVNADAFDIEQAFKIGQYIDYYQIANFRVNDTVYVIVNEEGLKPKLRYVCKVVEVNIEFDDEKYFSSYDQSSSEVIVSDFLCRLLLTGTILKDNINEFELSQLSLNYIPQKPMKNIGENKDLFTLIDAKLRMFLKPLHSTITDQQDHEEREKQYYLQRNLFLEKFPNEQWENISFDYFFEYQSLFLNEFNQHVNQDEVFVVQKRNDDYFTSKGRINNKDTFIQHYKTSIINALTESKPEPIFELYKQHYITANHYYLDSPFLLYHEVKSLCDTYDLSFENFKNAVQNIVIKIKELNPETQELSSYQLTKWIVDKFKFIKEEKVEADIIDKEPIKRYISDYDFNKVIELLQRDKYVIVNGLINFGGIKHFKELLIKHGYVEYDSNNVPFYNYLRIFSSPNYLNYTTVADEEKDNVATIVLFDHHKTQVEPFSYHLAIPFFVEYSPKTLIEVSDFCHLEPHLITFSIQQLLELFDEINDLIAKKSTKPFYISKYIIKNLNIKNERDLIDYIRYRILPIIKLNQLETDIEVQCIELINELID